MVGGTSTGGLLAVMLGRLRMNLDECQNEYLSLSERIFKPRRHGFNYPGQAKDFLTVKGRFDCDELEATIKEILVKRRMPVDELLQERDPLCNVFVCAVRTDNSSCAILRSYENGEPELLYDDCKIWEACRATSAATSFFDPIKIGPFNQEFADGGIIYNNPIQLVHREAEATWPARMSDAIMVSIGTGSAPGSAFQGNIKNIVLAMKDIVTQTERTADDFFRALRNMVDQGCLYRFNVYHGLAEVGLDEHKEQSMIASATQVYLEQGETGAKVQACVGELTKIYPQVHRLPLRNKTVGTPGAVEELQESTPLKTFFIAPPPSAEEFTGREEYMSRLESTYARDKHIRIALYGLSGIGKTRIALQTVYKWKRLDSTSIFWVHAGTAQRLEIGYSEIAKAVDIKGWDPEDPETDKLQLVKNWFEKTISGHWILVIDNADDVDLLFGKSRLADCFPKSPNGFILLTTRNSQVATKFTVLNKKIQVTALKKEDSINLLKTKIGDQFGEHEYLRLANTLDHLPLALVQSAAFMHEQSISISEYLHLYNKSDNTKIQLLSEDFEDDTRDKDSKNPVAATFAISLKQIRKSDPRAADILSMMSMLDARAIPTSLLPLEENIASIKALGTLQAFSLITKASQEDQLFDIHRLVRLAVHSWLNINRELSMWVRKAITKMSEQFPAAPYENQFICRAYLPHALAVLSLAESIQPSEEASMEEHLARALLQINVSYYFQVLGDLKSAVSSTQRALALAEALLGKEHPCTLRSMCDMSWVLARQHKHKEAEEMSRRALALSKAVVGTEPSTIVGIMQVLAEDLDWQGKYEEAEQLQRQILAWDREMLGTEHPQTLASMGFLASVLDRRGKFEEAEDMGRETLALWRAAVGTEDPKTLVSMKNLALFLSHRGKYEVAENICRETLALTGGVSATDKLLTLLCMNVLAEVLDGQGKHEEAEKLIRQMLTSEIPMWNPEHHITLMIMNNLGLFLSHQGKYKEAEETMRKTLSLCKTGLSMEHWVTQTCMSNLALLLNSQGK